MCACMCTFYIFLTQTEIDDDEFRFNDTSTHEGHLRQNGILTWFGIETAIMITSYIWMKI